MVAKKKAAGPQLTRGCFSVVLYDERTAARRILDAWHFIEGKELQATLNRLLEYRHRIDALGIDVQDDSIDWEVRWRVIQSRNRAGQLLDQFTFSGDHSYDVRLVTELNFLWREIYTLRELMPLAKRAPPPKHKGSKSRRRLAIRELKKNHPELLAKQLWDKWLESPASALYPISFHAFETALSQENGD